MTTKTEVPTDERHGVHRAVEAKKVELRLAAAGVVRADNVEITNGGAGVVVGGERVALDRAGGRLIISGGPLTMERAGAGMVIAAGDATIEQGGAGMMLTRTASIGRGGFIGLALAPRVQVEDGGRVLAGPRELAVMGIVAAALMSLAFMLSRVVRPGRGRRQR